MPAKKAKKKPAYDHVKVITEVLEWLDYNPTNVEVSHHDPIPTDHTYPVQWRATVVREVGGAIEEQTLHGAYTVPQAHLGADRIIKISVVTGIGLDGHRFALQIDQVLAACNRYFFVDHDRNKLIELALRDCLNTAALEKVEKKDFDEWFRKYANYKQNKDQFYAHVEISTGERPVKRLRHRKRRK